MNIRNDNGITLTSLAIYVILVLAIVTVVGAFNAKVNKSIESIGEYTSEIPEINKIHMYMLDEANILDNKIAKRSSDGKYIEFTSGNKYMFSDNKLYKNSIKILSGIEECIFSLGEENGNDILYVDVKLENSDNQTKKLKYVMNKTVKIDDLEGVLITEVVKVGDYIDYNAGKWTGDEFKDDIGKESELLNWSNELPSIEGEFGGFTIGKSRNTNSTEFDANYKPRTSGWRIWDIDYETGNVTIIHAGHPETYYHGSDSATSISKLRNRDCSMYENEYAVSGKAHFLTSHEAAAWYTKYCLTSEEKASKITYELEQYNEDIDNDGVYGEMTFRDNLSTFTTNSPVDVLENGSFYVFASAYSEKHLYRVGASWRNIGGDNDDAYGIRPLVTLKPGILIDSNKGDGSANKPWKFVK